MSSLALASAMFGSVLAGTLAALWLARRLPDHHLDSASRDVIKLGLGVIGTLAALVLGLLVSSTKGIYDAQSATVKDLAAQLGLLDRVLGRYGPETAPARAQVRALTQSITDQLWPHDGAPVEYSGGASRGIGEGLFDAIAALEPRTDAQRMLKGRAQDILVGLGHARQRLAADSDRSIPTLLLVMLGVWQGVLFAGFGLLAPRNATTVGVLTVCMLSVSGALYVVLELDRPFEGVVRVSDAPLRAVLAHMGE
ncbi:Uncharacterized protein OS=Pseudomonas sp. GM41(2012) GN=PMI27_000413 PE=4 SV=1: DUF4239 [Gemmataceae bacterium]|nr:Uncharacterized protein OS=Pseudomonas sp. GM41(2012) GN=PMI27_000413 PE=4 SV=1: DUF4239 [Gemmataceae bacterium]VTU00417.1 Uncharacterized protein OS=Pseudomonas sp. GM41(2012) GN=PMI27_000413 PE=4 SV=1: DUF4239 [Gemmataceae bacterium]